jgi:hypothetical protein
MMKGVLRRLTHPCVGVFTILYQASPPLQLVRENLMDVPQGGRPGGHFNGMLTAF